MGHEDFFDLEIDASGDIYLETDGDLATVTGGENIMQSVAIDVMNRTSDALGRPITKTVVADIEGAIRDSLDADPQVDTIEKITLVQVHDTEGRLDFNVGVNGLPEYELTYPPEDLEVAGA